ncbi:MAG: hypothetical protein HYZ14_02230 [Bacteroidetes bacterium]|nr:hypothetical protein [Bacteroidota bacterium]
MSLIIDDDSLIFREHRTAKLHKNFVDGASYTLQDNHLYRDGKKISLMPAELHGNTYTYVSRIDSMLLIFKEDLLVIEAEDTVFSVQAEIRTGTDYFVINVFSEFRHNVWVSYVFRELEGNKLEIRAAPAFSKLNEKTMRTTYHATIQEPSLYLMDPNNQAMFEKLMQNVFVSVLVLQKKQ